jgi:hypothetical protein
MYLFILFFYFKTALEAVVRQWHAVRVHVYCSPSTGLAHFPKEEEEDSTVK